MLAVGTELLVERDPPAGIARVGGLHDEVEQVVLVAGVEEVEDDVLVQHAIRFGRLGAGGEALAKKRGERRRPLGQPGDVRVLHRAVGAHAPHAVGVDERRSERRTLGLDALGEEGVRVPQAGERGRQRPLLRAHEAHVQRLDTGWSAGVKETIREQPRGAVELLIAQHRGTWHAACLHFRAEWDEQREMRRAGG